MGCALCRTCVSKQKRRTVEDPFDLDLTVIHKNITVMGYPSSGIEACYRNPYEDAKAFLDKKFGKDYLVVNLCSESNRQYDPIGYFDGRCVRIPFPDHSPCALEEIPAFIELAREYVSHLRYPLPSSRARNEEDSPFHSTSVDGGEKPAVLRDCASDHQPCHTGANREENGGFDDIRRGGGSDQGRAQERSNEMEGHAARRVEGGMVAIHCKAGKGRSGLMACVLLMALNPRDCPTAEKAMAFYAQSRTHDGKGLTIPSQRRYVLYYEQLLRQSAGEMPSSVPTISLNALTVSGLWRHVEKAEVVRIRVGRYNSTRVVQFSINAEKAKRDGVIIAKDKAKDTVTLSFEDCNFPLLRDLQGDVRIDFLKSGTGKAVWLASLTFHTLFVKPFYSFKEIDKLYKAKGATESDGFAVSFTKIAPSIGDAHAADAATHTDVTLAERGLHGKQQTQTGEFSLINSDVPWRGSAAHGGAFSGEGARETAHVQRIPSQRARREGAFNDHEEDNEELTAFKSSHSSDTSRKHRDASVGGDLTKIRRGEAAAGGLINVNDGDSNSVSNSSMSSSFGSNSVGSRSSAKDTNKKNNVASARRGGRGGESGESSLDDPML